MYFFPAFYLRLAPFLGCIIYCYVCVCMFGVMGKAQQTDHMLVLSPPVVTSSRGPGAWLHSLQLRGMTLRVVDNSSASFSALRRPAAASPLEFSSPPLRYVSISPPAPPQTDPAHPLSRRAPTDRSGDQVYLQTFAMESHVADHPWRLGVPAVVRSVASGHSGVADM